MKNDKFFIIIPLSVAMIDKSEFKLHYWNWFTT